MTALEPFHGPILKVHRAGRHIAELSQVLEEYGRRLVVTYEAIQDDPKHKRIKFSEPAPREISLIIGDAIHNLRSALDLMICDIARLRGRNPNKLHFPFAKDAQAFEDALNGEIKRLGKDVLDALRELKPYKLEGNHLLRALHDLDIKDKHDLVLSTIAVSWFYYDHEKALNDSIQQTTPGAAPVRMLVLGDARALDVEGGIVPVEAEQYFRTEPGPATALFADGLPLARAHVLPTLIQLAQLTETTVNSFIEKFAPDN